MSLDDSWAILLLAVASSLVASWLALLLLVLGRRDSVVVRVLGKDLIEVHRLNIVAADLLTPPASDAIPVSAEYGTPKTDNPMLSSQAEKPALSQ